MQYNYVMNNLREKNFLTFHCNFYMISEDM